MRYGLTSTPSFFLERLPDIDVGEHPESFGVERFPDALDDAGETFAH
jgi:hypothetical protein